MGLEILKYDPNDYKLGEVLSSKNGEEITTSDKISAVFSLYFQWPDEASAQAYFDLPGRPTFKISMEYDKEERSLSQILLKLPDDISLKDADKAFVRLEVFNGCYEFESPVLEIFYDNSLWVIIEPPTKLKSVKVRRSSRIEISDKMKGALKGANGEKQVSITSITLNGVVIDEKIENGFTGTLTINDQNFKATYARETNNQTALQIEFRNDEESTNFFEIYRQIAYPHLKPRVDINFKDLYKLFIDGGFFGNFAGKFDETDREEKVIACWQSLIKANHLTTADYVATDDEGNPIGSSSCALAFKREDKEYWVFHQLCTKKEASNFDITSDLYSWRAEYLWIRKPAITSVFWFRSESRWLERIYVKYAIQSPERCKVEPADLFAYIHQTTHQEASPSSIVENYGVYERAYYTCQTTIGGLGPDYVHINRNMNLIQSDTDDWSEIYKAANDLTAATSQESAYFRLVLPHKSKNPELTEERWERQKGVDRHSEITKEGMLDFIACLKHSIAITKKKYQKAG